MTVNSLSRRPRTGSHDGDWSNSRRVVSVLASIKRAYRKCVPAAMRRSRLVRRALRHINRHLPHDVVYDEDYYRLKVDSAASRSAAVIARSIVADIVPRTRSAIDVGCGTGALLEELRARGCEVCGLEYSDAALARLRSVGLRVFKSNFEQDDFSVAERFDLVVSMEVAEHLPEKVAGRFVDLLCRLADRIVFTAAPPGQGGTDHVNEQPAEYWVDMFRKRGFRHDAGLSESWRESWRCSQRVQSFYYDNLMVFRRETQSRTGVEVIHPGSV